MKYSYQKFIELVEDELDSQSKFGFFVRGLEFQEESKLKINEIIKLITMVRNDLSGNFSEFK